jgi:2-polyprenyl-3-methyl-5-hydroxy-6-metoxy-1,4-benzoquinol methylase
MNYHQFFVDNINGGDRILDVGCGNGALAFDLAHKARCVVAIDSNEASIEFARHNYVSPNITYRVADVTRSLGNQEFDVIVLSNVLEHLRDRQVFLEQIKKLAPKILIRVPMIDRDWITSYKKELGVEWRLDKTHFIEYTLGSLERELEIAGLKLDNYKIQYGEVWGTVACQE